jgi:hypothetical protein
MSDLIEFLEKNAIGICVVLSIVALVFIMIGHVYRERVQLALKKEFVKLPAVSVDWWTISHIGLYTIFGFLIPNKHSTFLAIGVLFELVEDMLSSNETTQLTDCTKLDNKNHPMCKLSINDGYWYAKWDDIFANVLGYTLGSSIKTTFIHVRCKYVD